MREDAAGFSAEGAALTIAADGDRPKSKKGASDGLAGDGYEKVGCSAELDCWPDRLAK